MLTVPTKLTTLVIPHLILTFVLFAVAYCEAAPKCEGKKPYQIYYSILFPVMSILLPPLHLLLPDTQTRILIPFIYIGISNLLFVTKMKISSPRKYEEGRVNLLNIFSCLIDNG